jgi:DNA-binding NarL/FixJ family response regulator
MKKIKLLLIEDNQLLRDGIIAMLNKCRDIRILAESKNNGNTVLKIQQLMPDIILLDLGLRNQNSLKVVSIIKRDFPNAKVIVMDLAPVQGDVNLFVKAGASGFILKDTTSDQLLNTIHEVAAGTNVLPPDLTDSLFSQIVEHGLRGGKVKLSEAVRMTKREREVIRMIGDGIGNREIGRRMNISIFTVKSHIHNIMEKLVLHTRLEVANYSFTDKSFKDISKNISMINN